MTELENIGKLAASASELLNAIRGGEIANMKAEHTQTLEEFVAAYNAKINEFTQQKGEALNQFNQEKAQAFAAADSELAGRRAAVDAVFNSLVEQHANVIPAFYDNTIHSKTSLALEADPADLKRSKWTQVPSTSKGYLSYPVANRLTRLYLTRAVSSYTGSTRTWLQFIVASHSATQEQIEAEIANHNIKFTNIGGGNEVGHALDIDTVKVAGLHPYCRLYVRAVNAPNVDGAVADNLNDGGFNASFAVDRILNYPVIQK